MIVRSITKYPPGTTSGNQLTYKAPLKAPAISDVPTSVLVALQSNVMANCELHAGVEELFKEEIKVFAGGSIKEPCSILPNIKEAREPVPEGVVSEPRDSTLAEDGFAL